MDLDRVSVINAHLKVHYTFRLEPEAANAAARLVLRVGDGLEHGLGGGAVVANT